MKLFLILLILSTTIFANSIELKQTYFIDKTNSLNIQDILNKQKNFLPLKKTNLGVTKNSIWLHLNLKNQTKTDLQKRVHAKRSGLDFIDVYILKNNKIYKIYSLGDMREHKDRDNIFRSSYFDIDLKPLENIDIFIKHRTFATMDIRWEIISKAEFNSFYNKQANIYTFISGILLVTVTISFLLFIFLKNKFYLIYTVFTIFAMTFQLSFAGFFYQFGMPIYLTNFFNYFVSVTGGAILGLFPFYFFNLKKNEFKYLSLIIKISMSLSFLTGIMFLFYPFYPELLYNAKYSNFTSLITIISLAILSIRLFIAKKKGSFFYLLANLFLVVFITIFLLGLIGAIEYTSFYYYTLPTGTIGQDLFLGLALIHATYLIKKEHDKNNQLLNEYSKLSFIGQTMINISHQWKTPINSIYNNINHIEVAREFNDPKLEKIIDENLKNIKQTTLYLKDTALNQLNFYKDKTKQEKINVYDEINNVIKLIENEFNKKSIDIEFDCDKNLTIECEKNYFLNILMILFENSFKIFEKRDIKKPYIQLSIQKTNNKLKIDFKDNAKGTSQENITKIFDKNYSLNDSTGIGLYLAKEIITHKLKGEISAQNIKDGIYFKIII